MIHTVHVFQIPPRSNAGGHRANDWTREVCVCVRVCEATIRVLDQTCHVWVRLRASVVRVLARACVRARSRTCVMCVYAM